MRRAAGESNDTGQQVPAERDRASALRRLGERGTFRRASRLERDAVHHHDPAAERHRQPAYGPCADLHGAGRADPLAADAGPRRAVAAGNRPCRHRNPDGRRAPAGDRRQGPPPDGTRGVPGAGLAVESGIGRHHHAAVAPAGRLAGLATRALHHGRRAIRRGQGDVRPALSGRADLPRPPAGQLGSQAADGDLRPRGGEPRAEGLAVVPALPDRGRTRPVHPGRDHAAGDDAG